MNRGEMKAEVRRLLGNQQTSSIFDPDIYNWIARAMFRVPILALGQSHKALNLFTNLTTTWTVPVTVGTNRINMPMDKLAIEHVHCFRKVAASLSTDRTFPMEYIPYRRFQFLTKDATVTGWPTKWTTRGNSVYVHPTPTAAYDTDILYEGLMRERTLADDLTSPLADEIWHDCYVLYAAYIGARSKGWSEDAARLKKDALDEIAMILDLKGLETQARRVIVGVEGAPTRSDTYGT